MENSGCPREDSLRGANVTLHLQNSAPSNKTANSEGTEIVCTPVAAEPPED